MKIRYFPTKGQGPVVINVSTEFDEEIPRWDVAIEALIHEEFINRRRMLVIADFDRLAQQYAIRFDDIMATVFELVVCGKWSYLDDQGVSRTFSREDVDRLCVHGRLARPDIEKLAGRWRPVE